LAEPHLLGRKGAAFWDNVLARCAEDNFRDLGDAVFVTLRAVFKKKIDISTQIVKPFLRQRTELQSDFPGVPRTVQREQRRCPIGS
jgi:hypothetical protein